MGGYEGSGSQNFIIGVLPTRLDQNDSSESARFLRLVDILLLLGDFSKDFPSVRIRGFGDRHVISGRYP